MVQIPYRRELEFDYGSVAQIAPGIRRVIANNPGPFTFHGTGTYILGTGNVAVIDPGPDDNDHIDAIFGSLRRGNRQSYFGYPHHMDHSPGCRPLQALTGAPTYAYGPHGAGKLEQGVQVEEGGDMDFTPDHLVKHGDIIQGGDWTVECVYTPGHTSNHMCFALQEQKALFTGDHVMGWSTSIISPPDGDMAAYMQSLELLLERDDAVYWPTHGPSNYPKNPCRAYIAHRIEREEQILKCIDEGTHKIRDMVPLMYRDTPEFMYPAAARSVLAAMENLLRKNQVVAEAGAASMDTAYRRP